MRTSTLLGLTAALSTLGLALTGCSSPEQSQHFQGQPGEAVTDGSTEGEPEESAEDGQHDDAQQTPPSSLAFGKTARWDDGLTATIIKKDIVKTRAGAAADRCKSGNPVQRFELKIENGTPTVFEPTNSRGFDAVEAKDDGSDGEAEQVFMESLSGIYSMKPIRSGRHGSVDVGFCKLPGTQEFIVKVDLSTISDDGSTVDRAPVTFSDSGEEQL